MPILLMLTFGIWSTARAWNVHNTMEHAVREAARYGATIDPWSEYVAGPPEAGSPLDIRAVADADMVASAIDTNEINTVCIELIADTGVSCDSSHTNTTGTDQVYVRIQYPGYSLNFLFFQVTVDLNATAISRFEATA